MPEILITVGMAVLIFGSGLTVEYGDRLSPYVRRLRARRRQAAAMRDAVDKELQRPRVGWLAEIGHAAERRIYRG